MLPVLPRKKSTSIPDLSWVRKFQRNSLWLKPFCYFVNWSKKGFRTPFNYPLSNRRFPFEIPMKISTNRLKEYIALTEAGRNERCWPQSGLEWEAIEAYETLKGGLERHCDRRGLNLHQAMLMLINWANYGCYSGFRRTHKLFWGTNVPKGKKSWLPRNRCWPFPTDG